MRHFFLALQYHCNDQVSRTADRPGFIVFLIVSPGSVKRVGVLLRP
jgi:hypothetical protein